MRQPNEHWARCDRCKEYRETCLTVMYLPPPPRVTPPQTEPVIGPDYIAERVVIDYEDIRPKTATMCRECRELKEKFARER